MYRILSRLASWGREIGWVTWRRATRASYAEYYAKRMDSIVRRNPDWGLNNDRQFQLDFARANGLLPNSKMLDYGCGALAAGVLFVDYLNKERYTGVDVSAGVLQEGQKRLADRGLSEKRARLQAISGTSLSSLYGEQFDFVWAQSVLTHMPPSDVQSLFSEVGQVISDKGVFFATFSRADRVHERRFKDWYYTPEFMCSAADQSGLKIEFVDTWRHPHDPQGRVDTMMKIVRQRMI